MVIAAFAACFGCASNSRNRPAETADLPPPAVVAVPTSTWSAQKQAVHVLNRLAFGPSPEDLASIQRLGVETWINGQLHPTQIPDPLVADKLRAFPTLDKSIAELEEEYAPPEERARMLGLTPGSSEAKRAIEAIPREELPQQIQLELAGAKLVRATQSQRQLQEVLVDFWFNHFNVSADKGLVRWMATSYERDAIRPFVFGYFRTLLGATAHHPAMLFYLDNWLSVREVDPARKNPSAPGPGLNENYARELLELHTVGVNGGYAQKDVRETARCFTGWSIDQPNRKATFLFKQRAHDPGTKQLMGLSIPPGGGASDGERVLDYLAAHPSTARLISSKLCRKFVSDDPPVQLVNRVADVFVQTRGYLPAVYAAIFSSREFWSEQAFEAKTKTPFEFAISAIRALGGLTNGDFQLLQQLDRLGEPLYRAQAPTGYQDRSDAWVNAGALVNRINFGLALASNRIHGTTTDIRGYAWRHVGRNDLTEIAESLAGLILNHPLSPSARDTIYRALGEQEEQHHLDGSPRPVDVPMVAGLLLGSPDFQKR
jgi:uncharacterized protein (DUF1800 family)